MFNARKKNLKRTLKDFFQFVFVVERTLIKKNVSIKTSIIIMLAVICFSSCTENSRIKTTRQVVAEWTGKEIQFPEGIPCQSLGKDTTYIDFSSPTYKILLYVDSIGCTSCRLNLPEWKRIIAEADTLFPEQIDFFFFFQPKEQNERKLQLMFRNNGFRHPVFIDVNNEIDKLNKFPSQTDYQCFLLDKDNKVVMIGNPSVNNAIWQLYRRIILERDSINSGKKEESFNVSHQNNSSSGPSHNKKGGRKSSELI